MSEQISPSSRPCTEGETEGQHSREGMPQGGGRGQQNVHYVTIPLPAGIFHPHSHSPGMQSGGAQHVRLHIAVANEGAQSEAKKREMERAAKEGEVCHVPAAP